MYIHCYVLFSLSLPSMFLHLFSHFLCLDWKEVQISILKAPHGFWGRASQGGESICLWGTNICHVPERGTNISDNGGEGKHCTSTCGDKFSHTWRRGANNIYTQEGVENVVFQRKHYKLDMVVPLMMLMGRRRMRPKQTFLGAKRAQDQEFSGARRALKF